jgi:CheY-like chemotaxis protein
MRPLPFSWAAAVEAAVQQQERVAKLISWFIKAALRHAAAIEALQEAEAAEQVACLNRFYQALKREEALEQFLVLLDHEEPVVSGMAAVYAMRVAPQRCIATLISVAKKPGLIGFRAQAALDRWESGEWPKE